MTDVWVAYDSYFGNTKEIAEAINAGMRSGNNARMINVKDVIFKDLNRCTLLIVGSPTRKFSPSPAIKKFLNHIPGKSLDGIKVTSFDTRVTEEEVEKVKILAFFVKIFGYAARTISDKLQKKGGSLIAPPEGFYVTGVECPLMKGESDRAIAWAKKMIPLIQ